jgi:sortase A
MIAVTHASLETLLRWIQRVLLASAVSALLYCGFVLTDAVVFQNKQRRQFDRLLTGHRDTNAEAGPTAGRHPPPSIGDMIGRIEIPRLGVSAMVSEGSSTMVLRRGVGHISGTALPGQPGNVGISGHRDTFFRPLRNIRSKDLITLTTVLGKYRYQVVSTRIVSPSQVSVLDPGKREMLTLVTCYPFYFIGSAPSRFIVFAERTSGIEANLTGGVKVQGRKPI